VASRPNLELSFDLVFGSDEFPQFANSGYIDAFGIFLNGFNIARSNNQPLNIDHSDMRLWSGTEMNGVCANSTGSGFTPVLQKRFPFRTPDGTVRGASLLAYLGACWRCIDCLRYLPTVAQTVGSIPRLRPAGPKHLANRHHSTPSANGAATRATIP
jgi:hypothetical protein